MSTFHRDAVEPSVLDERVITPGDPVGIAGPRAAGALAVGLVRTARPRQWVKNLLVFVAPGAAGVLLDPHVLGRALWAFGFFCVTASATYFMNDAIDADADVRHPGKQRRPVASGVVGRRLAAGVGAVGLPASVAAGTLVLGRPFGAALAIYVLINLAYTLRLKREPILDLAAVASGFLIRAIAGGLAVHVPLSDWFLIVASFASLFVVAGKRQADLRDVHDRGIPHRGALAAYTQDFLRSVRTLSAGVAITAYCLWAFGRASTAGHNEILFELTIAPFVLALLRYALLVEGGQGGTPEDVVLGDWWLMALGLLWMVLFAWAIYA